MPKSDVITVSSSFGGGSKGFTDYLIAYLEKIKIKAEKKHQESLSLNAK